MAKKVLRPQEKITLSGYLPYLVDHRLFEEFGYTVWPRLGEGDRDTLVIRLKDSDRVLEYTRKMGEGWHIKVDVRIYHNYEDFLDEEDGVTLVYNATPDAKFFEFWEAARMSIQVSQSREYDKRLHEYISELRSLTGS